MSLTGTYRWVPCSERLPEENRRVFVATANGIFPAFNGPKHWLSEKGNPVSLEMTHWANPLRHPNDLEPQAESPEDKDREERICTEIYWALEHGQGEEARRLLRDYALDRHKAR